MWMKRLVVLNQMIVVLGCVTQLLGGRRSGPPNRRMVAESLLSWSLPLNLGGLETFFFVRHVLRDGRISEEADHSAGDKAPSEVAVAHLAFGVLGLLSVWFRGMFWFATVIGQSVFLIGVAILHARNILQAKLSLFDVLMSIMHLGLLAVYDPLRNGQLRRTRRRWSRA